MVREFGDHGFPKISHFKEHQNHSNFPLLAFLRYFYESIATESSVSNMILTKMEQL